MREPGLQLRLDWIKLRRRHVHEARILGQQRRSQDDEVQSCADQQNACDGKND
jgi:hypothetical protein